MGGRASCRSAAREEGRTSLCRVPAGGETAIRGAYYSSAHQEMSTATACGSTIASSGLGSYYVHSGKCVVPVATAPFVILNRPQVPSGSRYIYVLRDIYRAGRIGRGEESVSAMHAICYGQ